MINAEFKRDTLLSYLDDFQLRGNATAFVGRRGLRINSWSFRKIADIACFLASELGRLGLVKRDRILVLSENSPEWVALFFGCLLRGIIIVPLDIQSTNDFICNVQDQVSAKLLLVGSRQVAMQSSLQVKIMTIDELICSAQHHHSVQPEGSIQPDDLVEIVFTSGTTSAPRGVCLNHSNILANLDPIEKEIIKYRRLERLFHPVRFLNLVPFSHVFGQFMGMLIPQLLGGEVWLFNSLKTEELLREIKRHRISVLIAVPRFLDILRELVERKISGPGDIPIIPPASAGFLRRIWQSRDVRQLFGWKFWAFVSGGATLNPATERFWKQMGFAVVQGYGMTETAALISVVHPFKQTGGSVGKILPGSEIALSQAGEILVRGRNVSPGLWNKAGLNVRLTDEEGWLHTGDLAQMGQQGNLYFKGRQKEVIVTSAGLNVFPEDLESVLNQQPEIRASAVIGVEGNYGPEAFAIILLKAGSNPDHAIARANSRLAAHQQILHWTVLNERDFPRTSSQKIRKRDLISRLKPPLIKGAPYEITENNDLDFSIIRRTLAQVKGSDFTGIEKRSRLAEDLKLDSVGRISFLTALEEAFEVEISESEFAMAVTVGEVADLIAENSPLRRSGLETRSAVASETLSPAKSPGAEGSSIHPEVPSYPFPRWQLCFPFSWLRWIFTHLILLPVTWLLSRPSVFGLEHIKGLDSPVLFVANHVTFLDPALILFALPPKFRCRIAIAMQGEKLRDWRYGGGEGIRPLRLITGLLYWILVLLFNVFSLPQRSNFRRSFEHAGNAMDLGYSILVFPEGERTKTGQMGAFRAGIGLLASGLNATIVPVKIAGLYEAKQRFLKSRVRIPLVRGGTVSLVFGEPIPVSALGEPSKIPRVLENAVAML